MILPWEKDSMLCGHGELGVTPVVGVRFHPVLDPGSAWIQPSL
jgi:hypothetical protein